LNPHSKKLEIATTSNQDPLLTLIPIIGVDIWEHAYYLQYLNVKADVRSILFGYLAELRFDDKALS
jgi:superoxide dismutase, Fe-Mn family